MGAKPEAPVLASPVDPAAPAALRLWRARGELEAIEKDQTVAVGGGYKARSFELILAHVKPLFDKHGLLVETVAMNLTRDGNMTTIDAETAFVCAERPDDRVTYRTFGQGTDKNDKGAAKAFTDAVKTAYKIALQITEKNVDEAEPVEHVEAGAGEKVAEAEKRVSDAVAKWANAYKTALKTAKTKADLDRLKRENKAQLEDPALSPITLEYFQTLYTERKAELEAAEAPA